MIEKILQPKNLHKAYRRVVSNKGSCGVDGMKVNELKSYIDLNRNQTVKSILNGSYRPNSIRGVEIPKRNGKKRLLGIPTVVDRWLQQAVSQQLIMRFELDFEPHSYGFRPKKNTQQAVQQALMYINDGYQDIVDIDLKGFFDQVAHHKLLQLIYNKVKCQTTLWLIRKWLRAPLKRNGKLYRRRKGVPQGSPLSPLLSNIMLDILDKELKRRGLRYVRYADDFSIYTKSKATARQVGNDIYKFLRNKLELPINREKSGIRRPVNFKLLGHGFASTYKKGEKKTERSPQESSTPVLEVKEPRKWVGRGLVVSKESWNNLKRKLKRLTKKTLPFSFEERLAKLREVWQGWINNYRLTSIYTKLKTLDEWLRNRLRYCIWHDWKKPDRKRKNLIRLGIEKGQAYAWSRTRMGGWAVAQSPILGTTITLSRLRRKGYLAMVDYYLKFKPQFQ